jgi:hypothetical protein
MIPYLHIRALGKLAYRRPVATEICLNFLAYWGQCPMMGGVTRPFQPNPTPTSQRRLWILLATLAIVETLLASLTTLVGTPLAPLEALC